MSGTSSRLRPASTRCTCSTSPTSTPLKEEDAYPAEPEEGYGWEKLYAEKLCQYYEEEGEMATRVARFHNIYGPLGTYDGGREKAPAAICRKVAIAQTATNDRGLGRRRADPLVLLRRRLCRGDLPFDAVGVGSRSTSARTRLIWVDGLVDLVSEVAGKSLTKRHDLSKPQGVRGRNSDNGRCREVLGWEPMTTLEGGLAETYRWIESDLARTGRITGPIEVGS